MSSSLNTKSKSKSSTPTGIIVSKAIKKIKSGSTKKVLSTLNGIDRQEMIATAAYYKAEQQGFTSGHEIQDWLEAETEIDSLLQNYK